MTSPDRSPRWTRTGLPVPGRLDLLPRLDYEGRLRGPGGPEPAVTLAWLGEVDGPLPVGAVDAVGDVASGWNQVLARVDTGEPWLMTRMLLNNLVSRVDALEGYNDRFPA